MSSEDRRTDEALVARVLAGDRDAYAPLVARYQPGLVGLCARILGSLPDAQDVAQETVLEAYLGLDTLRDPGRFGAWLYAIAANLSRMALRERQRRQRNGQALLHIPSEPPSPEQVAAARELHDEIVSALRGLPKVSREAVVRYYFEGYSYAELAELLGVPVSTIKGRLFKGRRRLRESLADAGYGPPERKERKMTTQDTVEVMVSEVKPKEEGEAPGDAVVLLKETTTGRLLPIWIGRFESEHMARVLHGETPSRPMTHDLALKLLQGIGAIVVSVTINRVADKTFYAQVLVRQDDKAHSVDARPSDAINLALRAGAPIYVARSVFEECSFDPEKTSLERYREERQCQQ